MKITNIYKTTAALIFLMVAALWPAAEAWGQEYVTGDRYQSYFPFMKDTEITVQDASGSSATAQPGCKIEYIIDNDKSEGKYWKALEHKSITVIIEFPTACSVSGFELMQGGGEAGRASTIVMSYSPDGQTYKEEKTFDKLDVNQRIQQLSFNGPVTGTHFKFVLTPADGATICLHEISFKPGELPTIQHRGAKWFDLREKDGYTNESTGDTFSEKEEWFTPEDNPFISNYPENGRKIQAAHTYIDTIYMHPGTSVDLTLPDKLNDVSVRGYQRWYSFRTDGTYRTKNTGDDEVWDLLTPKQGTSYRFANGYVSKPVDTDVNGTYQMKFYFPTETEFKKWFAGSTYDNDWYVVACDVSGYNDYVADFHANASSSDFLENFYEPTLTHRVLYYIVSVDGRGNENETDNTKKENWENGHGRLLKKEYQGGSVDGKYLEEYEISFPYTRVSNYTNELVALSKDARAYAIPDAAESDTEILNVTLIDGTDDQKSGIHLVKNTVEGESRVIQFTYPNTRDDGTRSVMNNNSTATILVTKSVGDKKYNIARYKLRFVADTRLLTQSQLKAIEEGKMEDDVMQYYEFRTPGYMEENYQLLTALNWDYDYDPGVAGTYRQEEYYPFPMAWDYSSYSFFDGSPHKDFVPVTRGDQDEVPQWGYYAIMNGFIENMAWESSSIAEPLQNSNYHLYVDASDRPGVIANLPFRRNLCKGSELFVTAWVKSAGYDASTADAGMLFTIMGVKDGKKVPLYRHASSQIRRTDYLNANILGCGTGTNEWMQVYFSFIDESDVEYDSYELQISNNSASTNGGDMYLDDVRVYMQSPSATVKQKQAVCGNDRALVRLQLGWDQLYSRLGGDIHTADAKGAIDFCIIDTLAYREYIPYGSTSKTIEEIKDAIEASTVYIGNNKGEGQEGHYNEKYATLYYKWDYDGNTPYVEGDTNLAADNSLTQGGTDYAFYKRKDPDRGDEQCLAVDIYAALEGSRGYWLLMVDHNDNNAPSDENYAGVFENPDDACAMKDVFKVTAQNLIKINGKVVGDTETETYCAGQVFNFNIAMTYPDPDNNGKETEYDGKVYFDWYFGTKSAFEAPQSSYGDVSIKEALSAFRATYPDATELTAETEVDGTYFTESHRNLLVSLLNPTDGDHLNTPLVLHQEVREIRIMEGGLNLVVVPINTLEKGDEYNTLLCWNPIYFSLTAQGKAPELSVGFNDVTYPNTWEGAIRVGLEQIQKAVEGNDKPTINIPLRNAKLTNGATGPLTDIENKNELYLIDSNDPVVEKIISQDDFDPFAYSIGTLVDLSAAGNNDDIMKVQFNLTEQTIGQDVPFTFNPREGYWYKFEVYFKEDVQSSTACYGNLFVTMHVVPAFQKWVGESTGNWNNDANWVRSTKDELKKGDNDSYANYAEEHQGYVPMDFTKVTIPTNKQVELYASANNTESTTHPILNLSTTSPSGETTENIEYDLMVNSTLDNSNAYNCIPYYTNTVNEIHFEPGAEMLHAEYLLYNKAWVDYQLGKGRWYTLASPLKAVVAGDFYTDSDDGVEKQEYFTDITFTGNAQYNNGAVTNNRFKPSVYQRAWKGESTEVWLHIDATTKKNVAISGNWSALTNDVAEKYEPGTGFSLKVQDVTDSATFRLPKADTEYYYYSQNGAQGSDKVSGISKVNAHRLQSDEIYQRTDNSTVGSIEVKEFTVPLDESADGQYYLVGNPFMAHLDMTKFFAENNNLESKYWVVDNNSQTVAVGKEEDLTTTNPTGDATVAPLQSFFVQKAEGVTGDITLTFTQDMQTLGGTTDGLRSSNALTITATTTDGRTSRAAVAYDMAASADYEVSEDAELFLDSNLGDVPMVYTVAGTMATSINRTSELYNIPLGVYGSKQEMVTLSFGGLNQFSSATLYDAQEQTETPLHEGKTVSVPAGTSGRYFLRAGTPTGNEVIARNAFLVYSVGGGKVMVTSSNTPLKDIRVYTMGGAQVRSIQASGMQQEIYLNRGIYLITVSDQDGLQETRKVLVR